MCEMEDSIELRSYWSGLLSFALVMNDCVGVRDIANGSRVWISVWWWW